MTNAGRSSISAAEQSRAAQWGAVLFRYRGWFPVPLLLFALLMPGRMTAATWWIGGILVAVGEAIRLTGVAAAGARTRRRSRGTADELVTYGIFSWVRNPLYIGNLLAWSGFTVMAGVAWFLPIALIVFAIEYSLIVRHEEGVLESTFGERYLAYKSRVSRWIPLPPKERVEGPHDWPAAWKSEISTLLQYVVIVGALLIKRRMLQ